MYIPLSYIGRTSPLIVEHCRYLGIVGVVGALVSIWSLECHIKDIQVSGDLEQGCTQLSLYKIPTVSRY